MEFNIIRVLKMLKYVQTNICASKSLLKTKKSLNTIVRSKHYDNRNILLLHNRGIFEDIFPENCSNEVKDLVVSAPQTVYAGFDPTASSLHVGNLLILKNLLHWQRAGHNVIVLIGTATAQVGDPSGRLKERESQASGIIREQAHQIRKNIETVFANHEKYFWSKLEDRSPLPPIRIVDNEEWYKNVKAIDFLSKVGRHFRMGTMLLKDSVNKRLNSESGMSFTEFSYQVFQAYDWYYLFKNYNCKFQIGGKDQMGNITAGHNFISRTLNEKVYGLTLPLVVNEGGDKFGKSVRDAIWLDPKLTTPFDLFQFFIRVPDHTVENSLNLFTFLHPKDIENIMYRHQATPEKRIAQNVLAEEVTLLVHGEKELQKSKETTKAIYHKDIEAFGKINVEDLPKVLQGASMADVNFRPGYSIKDLVLDIRCFLNEADAVRISDAGGLYINMQKAKNLDEVISPSLHILPNKTTIVRVGKKNHWIVRWIVDSF